MNIVVIRFVIVSIKSVKSIFVMLFSISRLMYISVGVVVYFGMR